jgi:hypothetical protein
MALVWAADQSFERYVVHRRRPRYGRSRCPSPPTPLRALTLSFAADPFINRAPYNDLAHLPGGFAAEPSVQAYLRDRRNFDFGAAQPGQVQPLLSG